MIYTAWKSYSSKRRKRVGLFKGSGSSNTSKTSQGKSKDTKEEKAKIEHRRRVTRGEAPKDMIHDKPNRHGKYQA